MDASVISFEVFNSVFKITKHNNRFAIYTTENWTDSETIEKLVPKKRFERTKTQKWIQITGRKKNKKFRDKIGEGKCDSPYVDEYTLRTKTIKTEKRDKMIRKTWFSESSSVTVNWKRIHTRQENYRSWTKNLLVLSQN